MCSKLRFLVHDCHRDCVQVWVKILMDGDRLLYAVLMLKNNSHRVPSCFRSRWIRALQYAKNLNARVSHIYREGDCAAYRLASMSKAAEFNN